MHHVTLRTRLTLAYAVILAVALIAFSATGFIAVRALLVAQLDVRLQSTASAIQPIPDIRHGRVVFDPDDRQQFLLLLAENHVNGLALADEGRVVFSNVGRPPAALLARVRSGNAHERGSLRADGEDLAYQAEPIRHDGRTFGAVIVWSSRSFIDDIARTTLIALLGATLLVIIVAASIGGRLSRRLLRPLSDLSALIAAIEATDLSERLDWQGADDELGRLCSTFDRLLDRLEAAFEQQRRFTADASHELRTPLSVMRAEIDLALARERDVSDYVGALVRLQAETQRLEALVEGLLLAARGDAIGDSAELVDLNDVARRVADRMITAARMADVTVVSESCADAWALGVRPLLESAVLALVDNAIRHTPRAGAVRVAVRADTEHASISVADSGAGFSPAALIAATNRFWRDDAARTGRGAGLGLSIARAIAQRHGGTLELRNAAEGGAVVTLTVARAIVARDVNASLHEVMNGS